MGRIIVNSHIHFGKPCVPGIRITLQSIVELLNDRLSFEEIIRDYYPNLQIKDIRACLRYSGSRVDTIHFDLSPKRREALNLAPLPL
jgi:uncharacterized protein (DUF433 family)